MPKNVLLQSKLKQSRPYWFDVESRNSPSPSCWCCQLADFWTTPNRACSQEDEKCDIHCGRWHEQAYRPFGTRARIGRLRTANAQPWRSRCEGCHVHKRPHLCSGVQPIPHVLPVRNLPQRHQGGEEPGWCLKRSHFW